jgi:DNA-binding PadR family transcriptional regulator
MERQGWIEAEWGQSESNRRAKFYALTRSGRRELAAQTAQWRRMSVAIEGVLAPEGA